LPANLDAHGENMEMPKTQSPGSEGEQQQINSETAWSGEVLRRQAEQERELGEGRRQVAEGERSSQETEREVAENGRHDAELVRGAAEGARESAEEARAAAEAARSASEGAREAAEAARQEAEHVRLLLSGLVVSVDDLTRKLDTVLGASASPGTVKRRAD
jgi:hypothetical protein